MSPKSQEAKEILAKNGFSLMDSDAKGVDFLANKPIRVQNRTRLGVHKRNVGKDLHMCFPVSKDGCPTRWFLVPHDELVEIVDRNTNWRQYECLRDSRSWKEHREYTTGNPSEDLLCALSKYELSCPK